MRTGRSSDLYELYAFCGEGVKEPLIDHLIEVSELCRKLCKYAGLDERVGAIAGLFHDVGKALPEFQRNCSFGWHEAISFMVVSSLIERGVIGLGAIEGKAVQYAVLFHHQAHRHIYEGIKKAPRIIRNNLSGLNTLSELSVHLVRHLGGEGIEAGEVERAVLSLGEGNIRKFTKGLFYVGGGHLSMREIAILRAYSGALMVSDKYVSATRRCKGDNSVYFKSVEALIKFIMESECVG
jgi:CRISPR-associated endonuclease Cas3-HD